MAKNAKAREAVFLKPGEGRPYMMGGMSSIFKADNAETNSKYSISEWWLEPNTQGPGAHSHEEVDIFFVIEGTMSFLIEDKWVDAPQGSFVLIPGGMTHDFRNSSKKRTGALNISVPGGFEENMPMIVDYFKKNPPGTVK